MDSKTLGRRMRAVREKIGLNQKDIAEALGVGQPYITRLETGGVKTDFLLRALTFYKQYISLDRLFNEQVSILDCLAEEMKSPRKELIDKRAENIREEVNEILANLKEEQNKNIEKAIKEFNVKIDAIKE
ncbi:MULTISPECIES: helix-turn-helix domain-containing protein [Bacteroidaceae]|jgi:transcriptional regulator with XRE-family HTH domain|uniref:helix-turn-helix domain-containing protein n=2 Tax=Bacteroidales TaxID=171549 RepID=UPI000340CFD5|nr:MULTISPECIES: helix-turn-helix transcriptional regulator [Phocaeicola]CCZ70296.1 helix-turn-helix domain-containing protein [Bacteroides sp. CAG:702]